MPPALISVVITTYNRAHYLKGAVASVMAQSFRDLELIIVDDGSNDTTQELLEEFRGQGIRCYRQRNGGFSVARNLGIRKAKGAFFAFLDDDDVWVPGKLQQQMEVMRNAPDIAAVYGHAEQFISPELADHERAPLEHLQGKVVPAPISSAMLIRREAFEQVGYFEEKLAIGVEMAWYARLGELGLSTRMLDDVVCRRRLHLGNLNRVGQGDQSERLRVLKQIIDRRRAAARVKE